jgi:hypothetical protein
MSPQFTQDEIERLGRQRPPQSKSGLAEFHFVFVPFFPSQSVVASMYPFITELKFSLM